MSVSNIHLKLEVCVEDLSRRKLDLSGPPMHGAWVPGFVTELEN